MTRGISKFLRITRGGTEGGFTLLEYCAGAAVILAVLYVALHSMGTNMSGLMSKVGQWAADRSGEIAVSTDN